MPDVMGIIGTATGTAALLWNVATWFHARRRRVKVEEVRDAWYAVTFDRPPRLIVHCVARFANTSSLAGSIVHCQITASSSGGPLRDWRVIDDTKKVAFRSRAGNRTMEISLPADANVVRLSSQGDPIPVDPSAPVDRDICVAFEGDLPAEAELDRLTLHCRDNRGYRSSTTVCLVHADEHRSSLERHASVAVIDTRRTPRQF